MIIHAKQVYNHSTSLQGGAKFPTGGKLNQSSLLDLISPRACKPFMVYAQIW